MYFIKLAILRNQQYSITLWISSTPCKKLAVSRYLLHCLIFISVSSLPVLGGPRALPIAPVKDNPAYHVFLPTCFSSHTQKEHTWADTKAKDCQNAVSCDSCVGLNTWCRSVSFSVLEIWFPREVTLRVENMRWELLMLSYDWWPCCAGYKFKDTRKSVFRGGDWSKEQSLWKQRKKLPQSWQQCIFLELLHVLDALL